MCGQKDYSIQGRQKYICLLVLLHRNNTKQQIIYVNWVPLCSEMFTFLLMRRGEESDVGFSARGTKGAQVQGCHLWTSHGCYLRTAICRGLSFIYLGLFSADGISCPKNDTFQLVIAMLVN